MVRRLIETATSFVAVDTSNVARPDALTKAAGPGQIGARHWSMPDFDAMQSLVAPRKRGHSDLPIV
jgi:hypothetical protein